MTEIPVFAHYGFSKSVKELPQGKEAANKALDSIPRTLSWIWKENEILRWGILDGWGKEKAYQVKKMQ